MLYLGAYLLLNGLHVSISFEDGWRLRNVMLVVLTLVKINPPLKIFDASSFVVQMVRGVFQDPPPLPRLQTHGGHDLRRPLGGPFR